MSSCYGNSFNLLFSWWWTTYGKKIGRGGRFGFPFPGTWPGSHPLWVLALTAFLRNGTGTQLILRFLTFFKQIEPWIYVCLSSYAKVVAFHVSSSRPRHLYQVPSCKQWKFKSRSAFLGTREPVVACYKMKDKLYPDTSVRENAHKWFSMRVPGSLENGTLTSL